jgi:cytochrome c-type biogenesis protein
MTPVLGVVFSVASNDPLRALGLLAAFGIGHCAVIVGAGGSVGAVQRYLAWSGRSRSLLWMKRGAGVLVILAGVYFVTTAF